MTRPDPPAVFAWLLGRQRFGVKLGLERMRELLTVLGRPERSFRAVLVGGTNGKGSTASVLAAGLRASGARVGLYTSPHLQRLTERVAVDGAPVADASLAAALARIRPEAERVDATFFEAITAAAVLLFAEAAVGTAVLEVGLGGRFDATNAVEPALSLITGVAMDHTAVLGDTLAQIAREKAGILRSGVPAWTGAEGEALDVLRQEAARRGTPLHALADGVEVRTRDRGWDGLELEVGFPGGRLTAATPLVGAHQARNVALALAGTLALGVSPEAAARGARAARWPGRLERLAYRGGWLVLDGAHNPEAAAALARALARLEGRVAALVLGVSSDKDVAGVVSALVPLADRVIATRAVHSPRAMEPATLASAAGADATAPDPAAALDLAFSGAEPGGTVVVAGSLFLVGEARAVARGESGEPGERWQ